MADTSIRTDKTETKEQLRQRLLRLIIKNETRRRMHGQGRMQ